MSPRGGNNDVVERKGLWAHWVRLTGLFKIQLPAQPSSSPRNNKSQSEFRVTLPDKQ